MTNSSPSLAWLTAAPSPGKNAPGSSGAGVHKASRHAAEAGPGPTANDAADTSNDGPSFAKVLRDQARAEQSSDPGSAPANDAKTGASAEAADRPQAAPQTSEQWAAWLAAMIKGHTPVQEQAAGSHCGPVSAQSEAEQLSRLDEKRPAVTALKARGEDRTSPFKAAVKPADSSASPVEQAFGPGALGATREPTKAAGEAAGASLVVKASLPRPGMADLNPMATALPGVTPGASAAPASATPAAVDTSVFQDVRRPEFAPVFSARIATLVQEGVEQARVHLNPVDMGPVALQLSVDGLQVRVDMTADVAATRQLLEQALPTLAGTLREAGFTLTGAGVSPPAEAAHTAGQDTRGGSGSQGEPNPQFSDPSTGLSGQASDGRRPPEAQPGRTPLGGVSGTPEILTTELHLDAEGRPWRPSGRGLVDTFA
jgi:flagellar hook-length control protein FliK